jgi:outer membrane protein assembly factor BamB
MYCRSVPKHLLGSLRSVSLPFDKKVGVKLAVKNRGEVWTANGKTLLQVKLIHEGVTTLETLPVPQEWESSGLSFSDKVMILAPSASDPFGEAKSLLGMDAHTRAILWEFPVKGFSFTSPVSDNTLVCAVDSHGMLIALRPENGNPAWENFPTLDDYPRNGIPPVLTNHYVLAVDSSGLLHVFERETGKLHGVFETPEKKPVDFLPAVANDNAYVIADSRLYQLQLVSGMWARKFQAERRSSRGWFLAPPVIDGKRILILQACKDKDGRPAYALCSLDANSGNEIWRIQLERRPLCAPAQVGDLVIFADRAGNCMGLDADTGNVQWQETLDGEPVAAPVVKDYTVFILTAKGTLYTFDLQLQQIVIDESPDAYLARGEYHLAAGAYLIAEQPVQAGLTLLKADDWAQAKLAFAMQPDAALELQKMLGAFSKAKKDMECAQVCETLARLEMERLGSQAKGEKAIAEYWEQAAHHAMTANDAQRAYQYREEAAKIMETPRFHLTIVNEPLVTGKAALLQIHLKNTGYGPARRVGFRISGGIRSPLPEHEFTDLSIGQTQEWNTARIIPTQQGPVVLKVEMEYERYRTGATGSTTFEYVVQVERDNVKDITTALRKNPNITIEKFFSPGATHNEIEIADSEGISIGDSLAEKEENDMDAVTIVVTALIAGLTAGVTETAKSTVKDIYEDLKKRLQKKVDPHPDAKQALESVTKKPESKPRQDVLVEELEKVNIGADKELVELAKAFLKSLEGTPAGEKYKITITDSQVGAIGDGNTVNMESSKKSKKK